MAKRARKQNPRGSFNDMVIELQDYRRKKLQILPRNLHQEDLLDSLNNTSKHIVFATGPAGTGKTMLAVQMGVRKLEDGEVDRLVITRPAVSVDEQHGFLPGDLKQKMEPCWAIQNPNLKPKKRNSSNASTNRMPIPKETMNQMVKSERTRRIFSFQ